MWFIIVFGSLLFLLLGLLLLPVEIIVHTREGIYKIRNRLLFTVQYKPDSDWGKVRIRVFFIWFTVNPWKWIYKSPSQKRTTQKPAEKKAKTRKRSSEASWTSTMRLVSRLLGTIKVRYLRARIDTGNFPLNAQLIPLAHAISSKNRQITINFQNDNQWDLCISHRPVMALMVLLQYKLLIRKK